MSLGSLRNIAVTLKTPQRALRPGLINQRHCVRFWTRISCMQGEYSEEWAELRRLRQRVLTIVLAGAAVFVLVPLITTYASHSAANVIGFPLFAAWVVLLFRFFF